MSYMEPELCQIEQNLSWRLVRGGGAEGPGCPNREKLKRLRLPTVPMLHFCHVLLHCSCVGRNSSFVHLMCVLKGKTNLLQIYIFPVCPALSCCTRVKLNWAKTGQKPPCFHRENPLNPVVFLCGGHSQAHSNARKTNLNSIPYIDRGLGTSPNVQFLHKQQKCAQLHVPQQSAVLKHKVVHPSRQTFTY